MRSREAGPPVSFALPQLLRVIITLGREGPVGRKRLSQILGVGEGATRTILLRMKAAEILRTDHSGCSLGKRGRVLFEEIASRIIDIRELKLKSIAFFPHQVGVLVRGVSHKVARGIEQRDAAILAGAMGAITVIFRRGAFVMPGSVNISKEHPEFAEEMKEMFSLKEKDVLIIVGAKTHSQAEDGVMAAALSLMDNFESPRHR